MSSLKTTNILHPSSASNNIVLDSSARVLLGASTARSNVYSGGGAVTPTVQIENNTNTWSNGLSILNYSGSQYGASLALGMSASNTAGTNALVTAGNLCGRFHFLANDGTNFYPIAEIGGWTDGTTGTGDIPGRLTFSTTADGASSPSERVRITNSGFFKATSTNGSNYLGATGTYHELRTETSNSYIGNFSHATGGNPYGIRIHYQYASPSNSSSDFIYCEDNVALRFAVRSNGGISNYSGNNVNLCDEREKKNIVNLDSTWDCLKHWELKKFHYNEDSDTDDLRYGVIAQQVADYCPEVISEWVKQKAEPAKLDDEGNEIEPAKEEIVRMGVKEQQMMWMAIKALQEAQLRIETLEAEVAALKSA